MPWIDVVEPYAARPRTMNSGNEAAEATIIVDDGWAEVEAGRLGADRVDDLAGLAQLTITDSTVGGVRFAPELELEVRRSSVADADLSQVRLRSVREARLMGCKLTGTDLSGASIVDSVFTGCSLALTNLRMAKLNRVAFVDCVFTDVDAYQLTATDVCFDGCTLDSVNLDGLRAERLDFRGADLLGLVAARSLAGCLVAEHQLPALAYSLALAAGLDIESTGVDGTE